MFKTTLHKLYCLKYLILGRELTYDSVFSFYHVFSLSVAVCCEGWLTKGPVSVLDSIMAVALHTAAKLKQK